MVANVFCLRRSSDRVQTEDMQYFWCVFSEGTTSGHLGAECFAAKKQQRKHTHTQGDGGAGCVWVRTKD